MRGVWRLAISSLYVRRRRFGLLTAAVALSAALVVAVACALASVHATVQVQVAMTVGQADVRVRAAAAGAWLDPSLLDVVARWEGVRAIQPRLQHALALRAGIQTLEPAEPGNRGMRWERRRSELTTTALGVALGSEHAVGDRSGRSEPPMVPPPALLAGRLPERDGEIVLDVLAAWRLSWAGARDADTRDGWQFAVPRAVSGARFPVPAWVDDEHRAAEINRSQGVRVGDVIDVVPQPALGWAPLRGGARSVRFEVVGLAAPPPLGGRATCYLTLEALMAIMSRPGLSQIDVRLDPGVDPDAFVTRYQAAVPAGVILQTSDKITAGLDRNMQANQLGVILATVMATLSAGFIVLTGLGMEVVQRERELAIARCVGAARWHLGLTQLVQGLVLGAAGAAVGVPAGVGLAWLVVRVLDAYLPTGLIVWPGALVLGAGCGVVAGLAGAAWPAWRAARTPPLAGLGALARQPEGRRVAWVAAIAAGLLAAHMAIVGIPDDGQVVFWGYACAGLPLMYVGYFVLGVPTIAVLSRGLAGPLARLLRVPPPLLARALGMTPVRHGLTAGALMGGLALMVAVWTNGGAFLRDWLDKVRFPDAFATGPALPEEALTRLAALPFVRDTCAVTLHNVETDAFGVRALQRYRTTFVGFEPEPFFRMTRLTWVQGDEETARRRLAAGGAVIVAREFLTAQGLGVGRRFRCRYEGQEHEFEIVGVVASPGLEIVSKFFNVGEEFMDQAVHAVFGSREDMKRRFFGGEPAPVHLIQIAFDPAASLEDEPAMLARVRRELLGFGVLDVGSGRQVREQIAGFARGMLTSLSVVAWAAMLVACCGMTNVIGASVESRRHEFGVLRAVGASRALLVRLIAGEAITVALGAGVLGTLMGLQGAWSGQRLHRLLMGIDLHVRPPLLPILVGWGVLLASALGAAWPIMRRLLRASPRDLLAVGRL